MAGAGVLVLEDFAGLVGDDFIVSGEGDGRRTWTLIEAAPLAAYPGAPVPRPPFSLIFRDPSGDVSPQGIYGFSHPDLGEVEIFVGPVAKTAGGVDYAATFN